MRLTEEGSGKFLVISFFGTIFSLVFIFFVGVLFNFKNALKINVCLNSRVKSVVKNYLKNEVLNNSILKLVSSKIADLTLKSLDKGVYLKGETLIKMPKLPLISKLNEIALEVKKFCYNCPYKAYFFVIPTKFQINGGFIDSSSFFNYEQGILQKLSASLDSCLVNLNNNIFSVNLKTSDFFFRTDNSINSFGSFFVYRSILNQMGKSTYCMNNFRTVVCCNDFYGNLYSEQFANSVQSDTIHLFELGDLGDLGSSLINEKFEVEQIYSDNCIIKRHSIFDFSQLKFNNKIKVFFGDFAPIKILRRKRNYFSGDKLLIFSDGSADSLMQFLAYHFNNVVVVDLNEFKHVRNNVNKFLNEFKFVKFSHVLFMYNLESLTNADFFDCLKYFY